MGVHRLRRSLRRLRRSLRLIRLRRKGKPRQGAIQIEGMSWPRS